ncbi:Lipase domain containing protein [Aphelenchoides besseyi]|nr:Lipase domain containing protein [Aphelenchoides besseyi]
MWLITVAVIALLVLLSLGISSEFDEQLAKRKFIPLASAAYSANPERCIKNQFQNATMVKKVTVRCGTSHGEKRNCFAFVGVSHGDQAIFLVYRGTNDGIQLYYEIKKTLITSMVKSPINGSVNAYFYAVYSKLNKHGIRRTIRRLATKNPNYKIWITGHSLGAALASIAGGELVGIEKVHSERIVMINFGQPRVGDIVYALAYEKLVPHAFRIVHDKDVVPHVPPYWMGYRHYQTEVFYNNRMSEKDTFLECKEIDAEKCPGTLSAPRSILDHITYFEKMFVAYGLTDCNKIFDWKTMFLI